MAELTVSLGGVVYAVSLPTKFAVRKELSIGLGSNTFRGAAAIVGLCVPGLGVRANYARTQYDPLEYGALVWEELAAKDVTESEMVNAALALLPELSKGLFPTKVTPAEVNDAKGFSSAPEEPSA